MTTTEDYGIASRIFKSKTKPGVTYRVDARGTTAICNCPGFRSHKTCRHVKEVTRVAREQEKQDETAVVPVEAVPDEEPISEERGLVVRPPSSGALVPTVPELRIMAAIAGSLHKARDSGLVPANIKTAEAALGVMIAGHELGVPPMTALRRIYVVNGKTEPDTQLGMALVRGHDPTAQFVFHETTAETCEVSLWRRGMKVITIKSTMAEVKAAGVDQSSRGPKHVWTKFPADMLRYYCLRRVLRLGAPDLLNKIGIERPLTGAGPDPAQLLEDLNAAPESMEPPDITAPDLYAQGDSPNVEPGSESVRVTPKPAPQQPRAGGKPASNNIVQKFWMEVRKLLSDVSQDEFGPYLANCLMLPFGPSFFSDKWLLPAEEMGVDRQKALDIAYLAVEEIRSKIGPDMSLVRAAAEVDALGRLKAEISGEGHEGQVGSAQPEGGGEQAKEASPVAADPPADKPHDPGPSF